MKKDTKLVINTHLGENFTTLRNRVLLDDRFSNNAIAVYAKIEMLKSMGKPVTVQALVNKSNSESEVKSALEELKKFRIIKEVSNTDE